MKNAIAPAVALLSVTLSAGTSLAGQATFTVLTLSSASDVTIDEFGRTLVLAQDGTFQPGNVYIYEDGTYTFIGAGTGSGISEDGMTFMGNVWDTEGVKEAAVWTQSGGWLPLGSLPNSLFCPSISSGYDISGDGSIGVGLSWDGCSGRAFRWTEAGGMVEMEVLGEGGNRASRISHDGSVVVGFARSEFSGRTPAIWSSIDDTGMMINEEAEGEFSAVSADGSIVAGRYYDDTTEGFYLVPVKLTASGGIEEIGSVPGYPGGFVNDMSHDGKTMVGTSGIIIEGRIATVWREEWGGPVKLVDALNAFGANVSPNVFIEGAAAVSGDGTTIVGWCYVTPEAPDEPAVLRGYVATIPPVVNVPCAEDLNEDGQVGFADLTQMLNAWGPCVGCVEDLNQDGNVGFADLTQILNAWGPCP